MANLEAQTYTAEEVAALFNVKRHTAYKWGREGFCGAFKVGKVMRFPKVRVDAVVAGEGDKPKR